MQLIYIADFYNNLVIRYGNAKIMLCNNIIDRYIKQIYTLYSYNYKTDFMWIIAGHMLQLEGIDNLISIIIIVYTMSCINYTIIIYYI